MPNNDNNIYIYLFNVENIQQRREPKKKKKKTMLRKFDEKEFWCELLNVSKINYKP